MAYYGGVQGTSVWGKKSERHIALAIGVATVVLFLSIFLKFASTRSAIPAPAPAAVIQTPQVQEEIAAPAPQTKYIVPKKTIWPGQEIEKSMLKLSSMNQPEGVADRYSQKFSDVVGKFATAVLVENMPIIQEHVTSSLSTESFISKIPKGYRAVTIPVDTESAVEGWVRPGVNVDVVWTSQREGKQFITTLVENTLVLSTNGGGADKENAENSKTNPSYVTLLLNNEDAQRVQLAKKTKGELSLNLRGQGDDSMHGADVVSVDRLLQSSQIDKLERVEGVSIDGVPYALQGGKLERLEQ